MNKKFTKKEAGIFAIIILILLFIFFPATSSKRASEEILTPKLAVSTTGEDKSTSSDIITRATPESLEKDLEKRRIIKNARLEIEVLNYQHSYEGLVKIVEKFKGFVLSSSESIDVEERKKGVIVVKVPVESFDSAVNEITQLGKIKTKQLWGEDVTEEYVDLKSRLRNLINEEEEILKLLKRAQKIQDILAIEKELSRVRGEIERITGRIRYLENRTDFSTIEVNLYETSSIVKKSGWNISETTKNAARALVIFLRKFLSLIIYLVVFIPVFAVIFFIVRWYRKKTKKKNV